MTFSLTNVIVILHSQSTGQQLTVDDDLRVLIKELNDVRAEWYNIGVQLGVSDGTLKAIRQLCLSDPSDCLRETLTKWLKTCLSPPTWTNVIDALNVIGEARLAADLKHKYTPPDLEVPSTTQLATVTTPPHDSAQENTGMNRIDDCCRL